MTLKQPSTWNQGGSMLIGILDICNEVIVVLLCLLPAQPPFSRHFNKIYKKPIGKGSVRLRKLFSIRTCCALLGYLIWFGFYRWQAEGESTCLKTRFFAAWNMHIIWFHVQEIFWDKTQKGELFLQEGFIPIFPYKKALITCVKNRLWPRPERCVVSNSSLLLHFSLNVPLCHNIFHHITFRVVFLFVTRLCNCLIKIISISFDDSFI